MPPQPQFKGPDATRFPLGIVATPNSDQFRLAERIFYIQEFEGAKNAIFTYCNMFSRGSLWTIAGYGGAFWVEETTITPSKGNKSVGRITYAWTGSVPPPEWSITPFEINPALPRHPFFAALTSDQIQQVYQDFQTTNAQGLAALAAAIAASPNKTLQGALLTKWIQGKETWYLAGFKYVWSQFYTSFSGTVLRGGYRENPILSVNGAGPGSSYVPQGSGWDYLRDADEMVWSNGLFRVTRTWIGAPGGIWDTDLYTTTPQ